MSDGSSNHKLEQLCRVLSVIARATYLAPTVAKNLPSHFLIYFILEGACLHCQYVKRVCFETWILNLSHQTKFINTEV